MPARRQHHLSSTSPVQLPPMAGGASVTGDGSAFGAQPLSLAVVVLRAAGGTRRARCPGPADRGLVTRWRHLAVHAGQLAVEPRLPVLHERPRPLLRCPGTS
jgi:hypothetical protein